MNVLSKNLSFDIFIGQNINNKPGYGQEKDLDRNLSELDLIECQI